MADPKPTLLSRLKPPKGGLGRLNYGAGALGTVGFLASMVPQAPNPQQQVSDTLAARQRMVSQLRRAQRLRQVAAMNVTKLRAYAPDLVEELLAGRRLPADATVIGGQPQTDKLQLMAMRMAESGQAAPDPMREALAGLGGVN